MLDLDLDQDQDQEFPARRCRSRCPQRRRRATTHFLPPRPTGQEDSTVRTDGPDMEDLYEDLLDDIRVIIREEVAEVAYVAMVSMSLSSKPSTPNPNPVKEPQL